MPDDRTTHVPANRTGLALFAAYCLLYAGFIGLAAFKPSALAAPALAGVNVAVVYGFGLIIAAFVLALIYLVAGRHAEGA
jgi:uncharacterized membrane protein (DUF485 family)